MLSENIQKYRKEKGFSQQELAEQLHVVRQTVSKWEKGISIPDAEVLPKLSELLGVSVEKLLGLNSAPPDTSADEIERLQKLLSEQEQKEMLVQAANKKRGIILLLSFLAMVVMLSVKNPVLSAVCTGGCIFAAVVILYRNLEFLSGIAAADLHLRTLRVTTLFNLAVLLICFGFSILTSGEVFSVSEQAEKLLAMLLMSGVIVFSGIISPRLPFTKHTGLRLPWTVQDPETWQVAHQVLGYISMPLAILYLACSFTMNDFKAVTLAAVILWIGIPGAISYLFFWKKMHGRR